MKWGSAISTELDPVLAIREATSVLRQGLQGLEPNLVLLFVSEHHKERFREIGVLVGSEFPSSLLVGCSARCVLGAGREVEHGPSLSLAAGVLPGVTLHPFHYEMDDLPDPGKDIEFWNERLGAVDPAPHFLLFSDPFSFDVERLLLGLDRAFPVGNKLGGVASCGASPGDNVLYLGSELHRAGAVGVALSGDLEVDALVAQGCRPIGTPMFVTRASENVLHELDGRPALQVLNELYGSLSPADRDLSRGSLFLGVQMRGEQPQYQHGDFLIRNLLGAQSESGSLVVGSVLQERQVLQFHLRDARASSEDLQLRLERFAAEVPTPVEGALLFSCLGRGAALYGEPDHDSRLLVEQLGEIPIAGFFGNGEIGPVQGQSFLHGYTSAIALFRRRRPVH